MRRRWLRVLLFAIVIMLTAVYLPAPIHPDCSNQPTLQCGTTCDSNGCSFVIWGDPDRMFSYCYPIGSGCLGGFNHPCCN